MKIAIATDSNSGISLNESNNLEIYLVNMPVIVNDKIFYEGSQLSHNFIFDSLKSGIQVTTSQPSIGDISDVWDKIFNDGYDQIIYIPMTSALSHSFETAKSLSENYDNRVVVVDNHRISVTLRNSAIYAKKLSSKGFSSQYIKEKLESDSFNSKIYLAVDDLEYIKRGGRLASAFITLGKFFSIKPIFSIRGGKIEFCSKVRGGIENCEYKIVDLVENDLNLFDVNQSSVTIGVAGAGISDFMKKHWIDLVKSRFPDAKIYYNDLPVSIAVHSGPMSIGIGFSFEDSK